jgi:predicted phosphate transport protein (TIGR00153 family)
MKIRLLPPRGEDFFGLFEQAADNLLAGAGLLRDLMNHYDDIERKVKAIKDVEHAGDQLTHEIVGRLNRTFVTPLDREDIHALATGLDDVVDSIEAVANRMIAFKIEAPTPALRQMTDILYHAAEEIRRGIRSLRKLDDLMAFCIEIKNLETKADDISRMLIAELFDKEKDPIAIIKWKEIYGRMEAATDRCEDIANIIEAVVVKNA